MMPREETRVSLRATLKMVGGAFWVVLTYYAKEFAGWLRVVWFALFIGYVIGLLSGVIDTRRQVEACNAQPTEECVGWLR